VATKVVMEALSPTMEEGRLVSWKKKEGDAVKAGETLAEVETDKAVMDLVARGDGVLRKIILQEGTTVPVSALVAIIGTKDEDISALLGDGAKAIAPAAAPAAPAPAAPAAPAPAAPAAPAPTAPAAPAPAAPAPSQKAAPAAGSRILASPLARRMAAEKGVDLGAVTGSGPAGRVTKRDVESAGALPPAAGRLPSTAAARLTPATGFTDVPLTQIRKTIAKRLSQSIGPIPHFFLTSEIDMERAWDLRAALKAKGDEYAVSFNDIIIKAVALALRRHGACNAWWMEDHIRYHGDVHIGMAVAIEDGLITPVIRFADQKGLQAISAEAKALADKARSRKLTPEEYTGATFSVSNLGKFEIDEFTAVINPPEAGILAIGRIAEKAVVALGQVVARRMMRVTMSCDHRVIDGATGADFLQTVKLNLENPLAMLL
jgi:pyruvate dehydrogenase E2 component (dihydrolipoamide acetyltransferase)